MKPRFPPLEISLQKLSKKKSLAGFTLSELLLATAILVIALSGLLLLFANCILLNESNRHLAVATSHAQFAMEEIKSTSFGSTAPNYNGVCWNNATIQSKGLSPLSNETVCITVTGITLLDVKVKASWRDRGGRDRNTTLETLTAEP